MLTTPYILQNLTSLWRRRRLRASFRKNGIQVPDEPALDTEFAALFKREIKSSKFYLEFGSGSSTKLAAKAGVRTISVESDPEYAEAVRSKIGTEAPVTIIDSDIGLTEEWGYPVYKRPTAEHRKRWRNYTEKAFREIARIGGFPDMVLVDGRFRRACALASAYHAAAAGQTTTIYFDDYVGRDHYHSIEDYLGPPEIIGRAARFAIKPESAPGNLTEEVIAEASADYR